MITGLKYDKTAAGLIRFLLSVVACVYCVFLFLVLPLAYRDKYFDIGAFKYDLFFYVTAIMLAISMILCLLLLAVKLAKRETDPVSLIESFKKISVVDKAVLIYILACLISYCMSPYNTWAVGYKDIVNPPLKGFPGWGMGLLSQLFFAGIYFVISKFSDKGFRRIIMGSLYLGSLIAFIIAILNRFSVDPLGFYEKISPYYKLLFLSTLGQATWYSSFLCTILPVALAMFIYEKRTRYRSFYAFYIAVGSMSLVTQNSDSAYAALFAALLVLFSFALNRNNYFTRYFQLIIIILLSFRLAGILQSVFEDRAVLTDKLSMFFSRSPVMLVFTIIVLVLYVAYSMLQIRHDIVMSRIKAIRTLALVIAGILLVLCASILVLSAGGVTFSALENIHYLNFSDEWGNGRGFTWRITARMFKSFPLTNKLFGIGPDCYAEYAYEYSSPEMTAKWGAKVLANAHNEWLNTLFNLGIIGFTAYFSIFASAFVSFIRKKRIKAITLAGAASIAAYVFHNFFCYQQVLCTPYIFAIIGLCTALE